jgi:hypothetical protein
MLAHGPPKSERFDEKTVRRFNTLEHDRTQTGVPFVDRALSRNEPLI